MVDPLVGKLGWGKAARIDPLLKDAHGNTTAFGGATWRQQVTDNIVQIKEEPKEKRYSGLTESGQMYDQS